MECLTGPAPGAPGRRMTMDPALSSLVADLFAAIQIAVRLRCRRPCRPQVHRVPQAEISQQFCHGPCEIKAVYDPTLGVFIDDRLDVQEQCFCPLHPPA